MIPSMVSSPLASTHFSLVLPNFKILYSPLLWTVPTKLYSFFTLEAHIQEMQRSRPVQRAMVSHKLGLLTCLEYSGQLCSPHLSCPCIPALTDGPEVCSCSIPAFICSLYFKYIFVAHEKESFISMPWSWGRKNYFGEKFILIDYILKITATFSLYFLPE